MIQMEKPSIGSRNIDIFGVCNGKTIYSIDRMQKGQAQRINFQVGNSSQPCLLICCYKCGYIAFTSKHSHEWHEDGSVTLSPSVVCPSTVCDAHYWIKNSDIVEC